MGIRYLQKIGKRKTKTPACFLSIFFFSEISFLKSGPVHTHQPPRLLQSLGLPSPNDVSVAAAIEANDRFIDELHAIRDQAQGTLGYRASHVG
jgi:hypothetical protein